MNIHGSIKRLRKLAGMSQTELARRTKIAQPYLSRIELGKTYPTMKQLIEIARVLNTEPASLLSDTENSETHMEDELTATMMELFGRMPLKLRYKTIYQALEDLEEATLPEDEGAKKNTLDAG